MSPPTPSTAVHDTVPVREPVTMERVHAPAAQAPFVAKLAIVIFIVTYICAALWLLLDAWVLGHMNLRHLLGVAVNTKLSPVFLSALHAMIGAVLGAGVLDILSFHKYVSIEGNFQSRHVWGYFVAPLLALVLGLIVFALLQSGLLVFAGGTQDETNELAQLGYLAVGFLAGFGWYEATESIKGIVHRFFSTGKTKEAAPPEPPPPQ